MTELSLTIEGVDDGLSVRGIARSRLRMSNGQFKRAKFEGEILLDGLPVRADARVQAGQRLVLRVPDRTQKPIVPYATELSIPYQDEDMLIVDKPAPFASAPSRLQGTPTLENAIYACLGCPSRFVYRPVNRLDKGTSGLMAIALNAHAQQRMQAMLHSDAYRREYLAVCEGCPPQPEGVINEPIAKEDGPTIRREVSQAGKPAVTQYRVLESANGRSLIWLRLETGRTHQIRVHMRWLGCPVVGDFLYGKEAAELPGRFALHSHRLRLAHPITGQEIILESSLPPALRRLMP